MNKQAKIKIGIGIVILFIGSFFLFAVLSSGEEPPTTILKDFGYLGMEIAEIKIEGEGLGLLQIEPGNKIIVGEKEIKFEDVMYFSEEGNNNIKYVKQLINLSSFGNIGFTGNVSFEQKIKIDYSEVRWNGTRYQLTTDKIKFNSWIRQKTNKTIAPNIFMDDEYNKRINYKDIAENGGYVNAFEKNGEYFLEFVIEKIDYNILLDYIIDPVYTNATDGVDLSIFGVSGTEGLTTNGSDFWVVDDSDKWVYHFNESWDNMSDGFNISVHGISWPTGITTNGSDFWILDVTDDFVYHINSTGDNQTDGFSTLPIGSDRGFDIHINNTDFWIPDYNDDFMYHLDTNGNNITDGFELFTRLGIGDAEGVTLNGTDFWITDEYTNEVYHLNNIGDDQSDGFDYTIYGMSAPRGIATNGSDFWLVDDDDIFVYHILTGASSDITACGSLVGGNQVYDLVNNITAVDGNCIIFENDNITFNMHGYSIIGDDDADGYGIYFNNVIDSTVKNGKISDFGSGIRMETGSDENTVFNITSNSNNYGVNIYRSGDINITESNFSSSDIYDVYISGLENSTNNIFVSSFYTSEYIDDSYLSFYTRSLVRKWYFDLDVWVNATGSGYNPPGAESTFYNTTGDIIFTNNTGTSGYITIDKEAIEYVNNGGTKTYANNYTINASHLYFFDNYLIYNITSNIDTSVTLELTVDPSTVTSSSPSTGGGGGPIGILLTTDQQKCVDLGLIWDDINEKCIEGTTFCGDGICQKEGNDLGVYEDFFNCAQDCEPAVGLEFDEFIYSLTWYCVDRNPETECFWSFGSAAISGEPEDAVCGDGICSVSESFWSCEADCPPLSIKSTTIYCIDGDEDTYCSFKSSSMLLILFAMVGGALALSMSRIKIKGEREKISPYVFIKRKLKRRRKR